MSPPFDPPPAPLKKGGARGIFFCSRGARGGSRLTQVEVATWVILLKIRASLYPALNKTRQP
jgi:hypothetical protein